MKRKLAEEVVLFFSVLKWTALATLIGSIVGLSTTLFLKTLNWATGLTNQYQYYYFLLPIVFFLSALMVRYLAPDAEGHGTEKVIESIHTSEGKIKFAVVPVKLIASVITIAGGGSAGKEGPCAQIGGGLSSFFSDIFKFHGNDRKKLVICGISAGFASVFGTPIAGAIFGIEVLFIGGLLYEVLLPSFISGVVSYQVSSSLGIRYFYHSVEFVPTFGGLFLIKIVFAGIFFGICSLILIEMLKLSKFVSGKIHLYKPVKGIIGGFALIGLTLIFSKQYLGLGLETIQNCLEGQNVVWYAFIMKIIFTSITLNFGGSGGIITPIFFIGSTAGALLATLLNLDIATFSAIGMVCVLAGAANTPIAASILAVELFGVKIAPYAAVACIISYLMTGHRSVYPSQVLAISKTSSIKVETGSQIEKVKKTISPREKTITDFMMKIIKKIKKTN
jgi:H+/Cl- antiporter ClcA